jgi:plasmid stabilization system protein ParE
MVDVLVCSAAEDDYAEALSWYAERSVQAAERIGAEFDRVLKAITDAPERFPIGGLPASPYHSFCQR